jgi:hypothetical protein
MLYQHSNLGVNAGISPASNNLHVRVGLRREFGAIVPKYYDAEPKLDANGNQELDKDNKTATTPKREAASSFVAARMRVRGPFQTPEITECLASGTAAINAASGNGLPSFVTALSNVESQSANPAPTPAEVKAQAEADAQAAKAAAEAQAQADAQAKADAEAAKAQAEEAAKNKAGN